MFAVEQHLTLPDLQDEQVVCEGLPDVLTQFHTPTLLDKPQNPIMDFLHLIQPTRHPTPVGVPTLAEKISPMPAVSTDGEAILLWEEACKSRVMSRVRILTASKL
jgi:hypothetical protein